MTYENPYVKSDNDDLLEIKMQIAVQEDIVKSEQDNLDRMNVDHESAQLIHEQEMQLEAAKKDLFDLYSKQYYMENNDV